MKKVIPFLIGLGFQLLGYSQDVVKRIDSLIQTTDYSKIHDSKNFCDTGFASHSDYFVSHCGQYHSFKNNVIRIVYTSDRFKTFTFYDSLHNQKPMRTGRISIDTFYFYYNTLIKAIRASYDWPPFSISYLYFMGNDLAYMEERGGKATDDYKRTEHCIGLAYEYLDYFRRKR